MKIYLVRHGETDWNKQLIIQGRTDNPLNETGRKQANRSKQFFKDIDIDLIVSSSLSRAIETATIAIGKPDIIDDSFIERDFGSLDGDLVENFYQVQDLSTIENYESDQQILARVKEGIFRYYNPKQTVAIFTHSHVLKSIQIISNPDKYDYKCVIQNCGIMEIEIDENQLKLITIH